MTADISPFNDKRLWLAKNDLGGRRSTGAVNDLARTLPDRAEAARATVEAGQPFRSSR